MRNGAPGGIQTPDPLLEGVGRLLYMGLVRRIRATSLNLTGWRVAN